MQIEKLRGAALDELFDAILTLENREECYQFFDDLCTVNEFNHCLKDYKLLK
ncbi:His repressor [Staphylococcus aureus]|nr:His repressor [Staphylococcus aureus]